MVRREPFRIWVGCGNEEGSEKRWGLFVVAEIGLFEKLIGRRSESAVVAELERELEAIVRNESEFTNVAWEAA